MIPTIVDSLGDVAILKIAAMSTSSLAVDNQGRVFVWGSGIIIVLNLYYIVLQCNKLY